MRNIIVFILAGIAQLALAGRVCGAQGQADQWAAEPLGPAIRPAPFAPAAIKRELRPTLKVNPANGVDIVLVERGRPACVLMVADQASAAAKKAAAAIQEGLKKMSGVEVAVAKESELKLTKQVNGWSITHMAEEIPYLVALGDTKLSISQQLLGRELPLEGYRIKSVGNVLFLVGSDMRPESNMALEGTRHAAVALLERHLGFRWLWPGELGEIVTRTSTVKIAAVEEEDAPAIRQRKLRNDGYGSVVMTTAPADPKHPDSPAVRKLQLSHDRLLNGIGRLGLTSDDYVGWCPQSADWWSHQRLGGSYVVNAFHAYGGWWNRFGAVHPEWFALQRDGSRRPGRLPAEREKLCHSNPELIQQVIREKIAELQSHRGQDSVSLSPNDGGGNNSLCLCEACRRLDPVNGRPMPVDTYLNGKRVQEAYVAQSDRMFTFYNRVAEGVVKVCPDGLLGTYAYAGYRDFPLGVRPHPNLLIGFVGLDYWDDQQLKDDRQRWEQWAGAAKTLFLRPNALYAGPPGMPGVFVTKLDRDIKRCYETGMVAADFTSVLHHWGTQGLNYYVLAKLLWDPSQQTEAIVQDYCQKGFGSAARAIRRYFHEVEKVTDRFAAGDDREEMTAPAQAVRDEEGDILSQHSKTYMQLARIYTPAVIEQLRRTLTEAQAAAGDDEQVQRRIAFLIAGLRCAEVQAAVHGALFDPHADKARLHRLLDERYTVFREIVRTQPFAVNVGFISWREGDMWKKTGWKPGTGRESE